MKLFDFFKTKLTEPVNDRYMEGFRVGQWFLESELKRKDDKINYLESKIESLKLATKGSKNANKTRKASRK